jgi:hypothetical protein
MTLSLSILVPYRPDGGARDSTWRNVVSPYWSRVVDEWRSDAELIVETPEPSGPGHPGDFNHPLAINRAAARARGDLLLVADADTLPDANYPWLVERALREHGAQWALPRFYRKLTASASINVGSDARWARAARTPVDAGGAVDWRLPEGYYEWIGDSVSWSGCVAIPKAAFEDVGGYDERIAWWGADDVAMGLTLRALYGDPARLVGVTHFWHPDPLEHNYGHERHAAQQAIVDRYIAAADQGHTAMRAARGLDGWA